MKKWNAPEMLELAIESTAYGNCTEGETAITDNKNYKSKTNQCECGHNTNFMFCDVCGSGNKETGDDTVVTDRLSA